MKKADMALSFLKEDDFSFPHPTMAEEDGLLAVGGDLHPLRLLNAYSWGIFPWYNEEDPILWWCPLPRFVLKPQDIKVSKSMRSYFNKNKYQVSYNQCFDTVINKCSKVARAGQDGTWIHTEIEKSYMQLHKMGVAHSLEVWEDNILVGGLYGLAIGKIFYGESMFSEKSNASKFGFIRLAKDLESRGCTLIDCQVHTEHLASLGAEFMDGATFWRYIKENHRYEVQGMMGGL